MSATSSGASASSRELQLDARSGTWSVGAGDGVTVLESTAGAAFPSAPMAVRIQGEWVALGAPDEVADEGHGIRWRWTSPETTLRSHESAREGITFALSCTGADAIAMSWKAEAAEHFYGLGERFDKLDQRGEMVELWVKNGAAGASTYKPVPFIASSRPYGVAIDASVRVFASLAHPTVPGVATVMVEADAMTMHVFAGEHPMDVVAAYTDFIGRAEVPPAWFFRPWKSRDWRVEDQATVIDDLDQHDRHDLPMGVKLIDAMWETESHSFEFDRTKYPDPEGMIARIRESGAELVLWISPNMTTGSPDYDECARNGYLITTASGEPYVHRLGNQPGWEGSCIDFTNPAAVQWWQAKLRRLLEMGVRGFKTDFGEQIPVDARFHNGKTGAEMHNLLPVLYNASTWDVVKEYDGILLARSAWAGSQRYSGIWAGDQSADFSPWAGLPSVIVAGQSAGWSGFPFWGSDVGGYFNPPDDEVFGRWAQFGAVSPVMEVHGLGRREPWEFSGKTLGIYREAAKLHDRLVPYLRAASQEYVATGLPIMRAMALCFPEHEEAHLDWVQYQYLLGPDLLAAPVYSWGTSRYIWFPPGTWIDWDSGDEYRGSMVLRFEAPHEKLPLFVRAGAVIPTDRDGAIELLVFGTSGPAQGSAMLPDGAAFEWAMDGSGDGWVRFHGATVPVTIRFPFQDTVSVSGADDGEEWRWTGQRVYAAGEGR